MNYKHVLKFALGSFFVSSLITIPFVLGFAYMNMVKRMGMPFNMDTLMGPFLLGLLMALFMSIPHTLFFLRMSLLETQKEKELEETQLEVIMTLTEAAESRCGETGAHIKRVSEYSRLLGQLAGLPEQEVAYLKHAAPLHDLGKIAIKDNILLKPAKFTPEEFEIMKYHAEAGWRILAESTRPILMAGAVIAKQHHEKWDGTGYPQGLAGEGIHIMGRIVAIADVFDALASERPYKKAWPTDKIRSHFTELSGTHFDPRLTKLFLENFDQFVGILNKYDGKDVA